MAALIAGVTQMASAADVTFHLNSTERVPEQGWLRIYGTIDCQIQDPPLYDDWVYHCEPVTVEIPDWANDVLVKFDWDWWCQNQDDTKEASPNWNGTQWELEIIQDWIDRNAPWPFDIPVIGDPTGQFRHIYDICDLPVWLDSGAEIYDEYFILDGTSPELPGYIVGLTPIQFDPTADYPFWTDTPMTGMLFRHATITFTPTNFDRLRLEVTGQCPGVMEACAYNANSGDQIIIIYGFAPGSAGPVPGCPGLYVDIANPTVAAIGLADASGTYCTSGYVPAGACGRTLVQAINRTTCEVSPVVGI
ncbi:MAG: hypothetical protein D8M59_09180 [Planctomycetes bacterium]|nr:hypothetical protein [Planctomycetota bacterium]